MSDSTGTVKAYTEKIGALLQQAKSQLDSFETQARGIKSQAEVDAIKALRAKHQEIDKKSRDLEKAGDAKAAEVKADIEADVAKFRTSLGQLATKLKAVGAAILIGVALLSQRPMAAQDVSAQTLVYATYDGENTATEIFKTMKANQNATGERIQSYAIVSKDSKGKTKVHDQRKKDARVGAVIGAVVGFVGGPVGAAAGATAGGGLGYLTGDTVGIPRETVDNMKAALTPGSSALVVVLDDRWVQDVEKGLREAHARQVIGSKIATGVPKAPAPAPASTTSSKP